MNAVQKEINARLINERELPPVKKGLNSTQLTFIVVGIFTLITLVLNHYGLIK